jgi:type II secretory pathway component PulF
MSFYSYKAIGADGAAVSGVMETENVDTVFGELTSQGLNVLTVRKASGLYASFKKGFAPFRVSRGEIVEFAKNLSVILRAGVPVLNALEDIGLMTENRYLRRALINVKEQVEMGIGFSKALAVHKDIFPDILIRLVTVGEETGQLEGSISDVAEHLQRMENLASTVKRALMYPVFAVITTGGALVFWMIYVLPKIMGVIKDMGVKLPAITRALIAASHVVQSHWYLLLAIPVVGFVVFKILKQKENIRYYLDYAKIRFPIMKIFIGNKLLTLFSEQLRILVVSGITIDRSLVIVANAIGSEVYRRALLNMRDLIMRGSRISDALRQQKVFPPLVIRMVDIGETSGNLDEQFAFLARFYFTKLEDASEKLGKMIEPVLIVTVGFIFAVILVGLLLPIYDIVAKF